MKRFLFQLLGFLIVFTIINLIAGYYYSIPVKESIKNKSNKNFLKYSKIHNNKNEYNIIFLGSSRGYTAYNPVIFDSILNTKTFNMCTSSQNVIETYYTLKEILNHQRPKLIVYEMFLQSFDKTDDYYQIISNGSFFEDPSLKRNMIFNGFGLPGIANYLSPILRNKLYIKADIMAFLTSNGNKDNNQRTKSRYWISGYLHDKQEVTENQISHFEGMATLDNTELSSKKLEYFRKIVKLCKEQNIQLICVRAPFPPTRLKRDNQMELIRLHEFYRNLCFKNDVNFYDLNSISDNSYEYLDTDFSDSHHLNYKGANKASNELANIIEKIYGK